MQQQMLNTLKSHRLIYAVSKITADSEPIGLVSEFQKIRELAKDGTDLDYISEDDGMTALAHAITNGNLPAIRLLKELGASLDAPFLDRHPLRFTCFRRPEFVLPLLEMGSGKFMSKSEKEELVSDLNNSSVALDDITSIMEQLYPDAEKNSDHQHTLFDFDKVKRESEREKSDSRKHFLKMLMESGPYRTYSSTPSPDCLDPLYDKFPNFIEVLDFVKRELYLANLSPHSIFTMTPIILHGAPGVGKTRFTKELSRVMSVEFASLNCGSISAGWVISGSSTSWQEGRPGMVLTNLRDGKTGNPVMMLDEVDKLSGDQRYDGFGPLYQLLEPTTSNAFKDEAVDIPIDCSKVLWIATANNIKAIPEPIMSRLKSIEVLSPTKEEMPAIIDSIFKDLLSEAKGSWGEMFKPSITDDIFNSLADESPRVIKSMIREALGEAALRVSRDESYEKHIQNGQLIELEKSDFVILRPKKRKMGF